MKMFKEILQDIRSRQNLDVYITASIAIIIAVFSIIGAPQSIVSAATLAILTIISIWLLHSRRENDEIRKALIKIDDVKNQIDNLSSKNDTKVTFVPLRKGEYKSATQSAINLIESSYELLILDYNPISSEEDKRYFEQERVSARRKYYNAIHEKIQKSQPGLFKYRRILQLPDGNRLTDLLENDPIFREHCEIVVKLGERQPEFVGLKSCGVLYQGTFWLIDRKILLFGVDICDPEDKRRYDDGYFYFDDTPGNVVGHFVRFFERADAKASLVKLTDLQN